MAKTPPSLANAQTTELKPYPMEELKRIQSELEAKGVQILNFGTGDPTIPTWPPIIEALKSGVPEISQYPSILGSPELLAAQWGYLERRFGIKNRQGLTMLPTRGSKEAVFHLALSIIGRSGKKTLVYPDPGYPVYLSSAVFAGGTPYPVALKEEEGYLLKPWELPIEVQKDAAAVWVNYPHNPTGATADRAYYERLLEWAEEFDSLILSDDCYVDIYSEGTADADLPPVPLQISSKRNISLFSLSKRSGVTGYRVGFMVGDEAFLSHHARARANFGLGSPVFIQKAAIVAWNDDEHVAARRKTFAARMELAGKVLLELGLIDAIPQATFYLWSRLPARFGTDDIHFCMRLAERGVISTPSSWLGENVPGYFRLAMVPDIKETEEAMARLKSFVENPDE